MAFRTPRDEREWRAMVERGIRDARAGIRPIVASAVDDAVGGIIIDIGESNTQHPTAPIELTYQTALYLNSEGRYRVRFMLDFPDVTKDTAANDITVEQYELWGKPTSAHLLLLTTDAVAGLAAPGATLPGLAATPSNKALADIDQPWQLMSTNPESYFRADGFEPGSVWDFRARAIGRGMATPGNWSAEITVQMLEDNTPPSQPSPPTLSIARGTITVYWDGQAVTGAMPADFKYAILAHGTDSSPTHEIARFGRGGGFKVVANVPYYDPQFFRLKAVDESGNESPWSEQAVGYTTPLVDKDVILSTIDGATTYLKNIDAGVAILPNTILTQHLVVTEEMTAALANFLHVRADMLEVNDIWADTAWFGVADAILVRSEMFEGKAFTGGTFTGPLIQTDVEALTGVKIDTTGIKAWNTGGENTFNLSAVTGDVDILGTFQIGDVAEPHLLLTKNAWSVWPGIRFKVQDPDLDYQPTIFAVGDDWTDPGNTLEKGDLVVMGGQLDANTSPRGILYISNRGAEISMHRSSGGGPLNGVLFHEDNGTTLFGHLRVNFANSTFQYSNTSSTAIASGTFTISLTPPAYGAYIPFVTCDGVNPVSFVTQNVTPSGYVIRFDGPASNITSFRTILVWRGE